VHGAWCIASTSSKRRATPPGMALRPTDSRSQTLGGTYSDDSRGSTWSRAGTGPPGTPGRGGGGSKRNLEKELTALRRLDANKQCPNCPAEERFGFKSVCVKAGIDTFVCSSCKSAHQSFSHRTKGIAMSTFTEEEVDRLKEGGNRAAQETWLGRLSRRDVCEMAPRKDARPEEWHKWIERIYEHREFYVEPGGGGGGGRDRRDGRDGGYDRRDDHGRDRSGYAARRDDRGRGGYDVRRDDRGRGGYADRHDERGRGGYDERRDEGCRKEQPSRGGDDFAAFGGGDPFAGDPFANDPFANDPFGGDPFASSAAPAPASTPQPQPQPAEADLFADFGTAPPAAAPAASPAPAAASTDLFGAPTAPSCGAPTGVTESSKDSIMGLFARPAAGGGGGGMTPLQGMGHIHAVAPSAVAPSPTAASPLLTAPQPMGLFAPVRLYAEGLLCCHVLTVRGPR
jgi:hypothetical protein